MLKGTLVCQMGNVRRLFSEAGMGVTITHPPHSSLTTHRKEEKARNKTTLVQDHHMNKVSKEGISVGFLSPWGKLLN